VWKQGNEEHDTATSDVMQAVMRTRVAVQHSQNYNNIVESIKKIEEEEDLNDNEKKRKMKRRKIMKGLRPFTGKKETNEKRKRGWSLRGYKQLMDINEDIIRDAENYKQFNTAVRKVIIKNQRKRKMRTRLGRKTLHPFRVCTTTFHA
jgi:hypothetical protein